MLRPTLRPGFVTFIVAVTLAASAGCLHADKTQTLYVAADGVVTWMVVEKDVRSDERDAVKAAAEEREYITRARVEAHPVAQAFRRLDAINVTTQVVRDTRPFTVITTAQFPSLGVLGQSLMDALAVDASSVSTTDGTRTAWTLTVRSEPGKTDDDLTMLLDEPWHIVLESGRFVTAQNVRIDGGQRAILLEHSPEAELAMPLVWSLTWMR